MLEKYVGRQFHINGGQIHVNFERAPPTDPCAFCDHAQILRIRASTTNGQTSSAEPTQSHRT